MGHVPHLYVPQPWGASVLALDTATAHHLGRVLRRTDGAAVSYTDGAGTVGDGRLSDDVVERGPERVVEPPPRITIAASAPHSVDRARYLVEKCAELGVSRIVWITTEHGQGRPPREEKARAWAAAALRQSRGAHLADVDGPQPLSSLVATGNVLVAGPNGRSAHAIEWRPPLTIVIGPEGGLTAEEAGELPQLTLGDRILRTETAAVVAAAIALQSVGRA